MGAEYDPKDATGFIKLFGLQMRVANSANKGKKK
jgi:argininosuccinate synthase